MSDEQSRPINKAAQFFRVKRSFLLVSTITYGIPIWLFCVWAYWGSLHEVWFILFLGARSAYLGDVAGALVCGGSSNRTETLGTKGTGTRKGPSREARQPVRRTKHFD
jgi:hypothetical protein